MSWRPARPTTRPSPAERSEGQLDPGAAVGGAPTRPGLALGGRGDDEKRIRQATGWINELVDQELERGVPAHRIVLAGFSQGGAMALFAGLRYPEALAGIVCLSGYLLLRDTLIAEASDANRSRPIFQAHGTNDAILPYELGRGSFDFLTESGFQVGWHEYPMAHQICLEELRDIGEWLAGVFAP